MTPSFPERIRSLATLLFGFMHRGPMDTRLSDEMRFHIDMATAENVRAGHAPEEARRLALVAFGGQQRWTADARDEFRSRHLDDLGGDIRYAFRALLRSPGFTISAALVLALGIGASSAIFSAVDAVLLRRLPYPHDEQLVRVFEQNSPTNRWTLSVVDFHSIEQFSQTVAAVGAVRGREVGVSAGGDVERLTAGVMSAGFFEALGINPETGRRLVPADEAPGAPATVVLGHAYAERKFGSAQAAVDHTITIDGEPHRVVGVLSAADQKVAGNQPDIWPVMRRTIPPRRGPFGLLVIARLRPGVTVDAAKRDLAAVSVRIFPDWQAGFQDKVARLTPYSLREVIIGDAARPLSLFAAAVGLVLLIAIANVASLSVVRFMRRWRELAVRAALGASRARIVRLMMCESILVAMIGGVLGIAVGWAGLKLLQGFASGIPRLDTAHMDIRTIALALGLALVAGAIIGLVPAVRLLTGDGEHGLRDGTRAIGDGKGSDRLRGAFVAAEFALALPVLAAGALLLTSVMRLQHVDPGFDPRAVYTIRVGLPAAAARQPGPALGTFWRRVEDELTQLPGVSAVGFSTAMPPDDNGNNNDNFDLVEAPVAPGDAQPTVTWPTVNPAFFATLHMKLLDGRLFSPLDTGAVPAVIVTRSWANHYFPGKPVLGRKMIRGGCTTCPQTVIVGVVSDVTFDRLGTIGEAVFSPGTEGWPTTLNVFVRTTMSEGSLARRVRDVVQSADPSASLGPMTGMEDRVYDSVTAPRHWATILVTFAIAALIMAAVGIFGLLSYAVALRRREIGVRMALGASADRVVTSMIASGMRNAVLGALIGLVLTFGSSRWLSRSLYGVSAYDLTTLGAVTGGLLLVALVASWLPARRAAGIDPLEAMRVE